MADDFDFGYTQGWNAAFGLVDWRDFNDANLPVGHKEFLVWLNKPMSFRRLHTAAMVGADDKIMLIGSMHAYDLPKDTYVTHWARMPRGPR